MIVFMKVNLTHSVKFYFNNILKEMTFLQNVIKIEPEHDPFWL